MAPVLGYWKIRGLAQPIRLLLKYAKVDFEDKKYEVGKAPDYDRSSWLDEKFSHGLEFPNLPYFIDGDLKLTQSNAIMRYLAEKHDLIAKDSAEKQRMLVAEYQIADLKSEFVHICYNANYEQMREEFLKKLPTSLKSWSEFLGKNKWISGETLTYVDFWIYETLDTLRIFKSDCLDDFTNLKEYVDRFEALPAIAEYMKSDAFMKSPLNNKMAKFGNE